MDDEPILSAAGVAVSTRRVVAVGGTYAMSSIARVRATYSEGGRAFGAVFVAAGVVGLVVGWWLSSAWTGGAGAVVMLLGAGAALVPPSGRLYLTLPDGERLVASDRETSDGTSD